MFAAGAGAAVLSLQRRLIRGSRSTHSRIWIAQLGMDEVVLVVVVTLQFGLGESCQISAGRGGVDLGQAFQLASKPHKLRSKAHKVKSEQ